MAQGPGSHQEDDSPKIKDSSAVRTPEEGESSSSEHIAPFDAPTVGPSDAPTIAEGSFVHYSGIAPVRDYARHESSPGFNLRPGMLIAQRYNILQILGQGGMGVVYKAEDLELNRFVALKVIRSDLANNVAMLHRFKQEIMLASKITDRHVVRIFDLGD